MFKNKQDIFIIIFKAVDEVASRVIQEHKSKSQSNKVTLDASAGRKINIFNESLDSLTFYFRCKVFEEQQTSLNLLSFILFTS